MKDRMPLPIQCEFVYRSGTFSISRSFGKADAVIFASLLRSFSTNRFYRSIRSKDVFVVYYPRSGGYWLRAVFAAYVLRKAGGDPSAHRYWHAKRWSPNLNQQYCDQASFSEYDHLPNPRIFKVHALPDPMLPRVIFLVRDPRDAFLSHYQYLLRHRENFSSTLEAFVRADQWPQDWSAYTEGWLSLAARRNFPVIRYEDLMASPVRWSRVAFDYAGMKASESELESAVELAWRECKRRRADLYAGLVQQGHAGLRDIREDSVGCHRQEFSKELSDWVSSRHRKAMKQLGYL